MTAIGLIKFAVGKSDDKTSEKIRAKTAMEPLLDKTKPINPLKNATFLP
jgi:hypothetical protein